MNLKDFEKELFQNPAFKKECLKHDLAFEISEMLNEARIIKGITQAKLARLVKTKQSSIARAENGIRLPSLRFLDKIAKALNTHLIVKFSFMTNWEIKINQDALDTNQVKYSIEFPVEKYTIKQNNYKEIVNLVYSASIKNNSLKGEIKK